MKKILFLLFFLISISASATKYYVATAANGGENGAGITGAIGDPWLTVAYAATRATVPGDTIFVTAGTYNEGLNEITLSVGVSIHGEGATSIINSTYATAGRATITASSYPTLTNGNQSISYIKLTGGSGSTYTARAGIFVYHRNNVNVHHCIFENFLYNAAVFTYYGNTLGSLTPGYCSNNSFHDNTITNCSSSWIVGETTISSGSLSINGQDGMFIEDNVITLNKAAGTNGICIQGTNFGINKNLTIRGNELYRPDAGVEEWDIGIELWDYRGNVEICDNYIEGSIDIGGRYNFASVGAYTVWIHDNTIGQATQSVTVDCYAVVIEGYYRDEDIIIERNYIKNVCYGIAMSSRNTLNDGGYYTIFKNIRISYNVFESIGVDDSEPSGNNYGSINTISENNRASIDNLEIINNICSAKVGTYAVNYGLKVGSMPSTNVTIRNNIILNFDKAPIYGTNHSDPLITVSNLSIENNIFYGNGNSNAPLYEGGLDPDDVTQNNIIDDPDFVGTGTPPLNYKLTSGSPAKDAGISVGLTSDYGGYSVPVGPLPDIGAWEYGADVDPPNWHPTGLGWDDIYFKNNFRDTVNFTVPPTIAGAPLNLAALLPSGLTATVNDLNATTGATGNLQGQINSLENDKLEKINAALSTGTITDATGITTAMLSRYIYYSEAAATDITSNPQIVNGTAGQIITIIGSSDTNTLTLDDGDGLRLSAQCVLGAGDTITLYYDGTLADWIEIGRSNN